MPASKGSALVIELVEPDSNAVAISPDGSMVAYTIGNNRGATGWYNTQLWVRSLDSMTSRRIESGDGLYYGARQVESNIWVVRRPTEAARP